MRYIKNPIINIERYLDIEVPPDNECWRSITYMETEGATLAELYNNAVYYSTDQEGGECDEYTLENLPLTDFENECKKLMQLYVKSIVNRELKELKK